jgi:hypothetical protein
VGADGRFVCRLDALTPLERKRYGALTDELASATHDVHELPRGWAFRFPGGAILAPRLVEWMSLERRCCPFLEFDLELGEDDEPAWLRLTGAEGVKQFLAHEIRAFFPPPGGGAPERELPAARPTGC